MKLHCTTAQAQALLAARSFSHYERKSRRKAIMQQIHRDHNLPKRPRLVLFVEDPNNPLYCVLRDAVTRMPLDDGRPEPKVKALPAPKVKVAAKKAPAKVAIKKAPAKVVKKAVVKKAVAVKAKVVAVKKAAPAKKVAAKKATKPAAKAPAKAKAKR